MFFKQNKYTPTSIYPIPIYGIQIPFYQQFPTLCKFALAYTIEIWCNAKKDKGF